MCMLCYFPDNRLKRTDIRIGNNPANLMRAPRCGRISSAMVETAVNHPTVPDVVTITCVQPLRGRYVYIRRATDRGSQVRLTLCEVLVNGVEVTTVPNVPPTGELINLDILCHNKSS